MPKMGELLTSDSILYRIKGVNSKEILAQLTKTAGDIYNIDAGLAYEAVIARETLGGTGINDGVATPHARLKCLANTICVFALLDTPVDFDAPDGRPADLVCLLLSPEDAGSMHLKALAKITRVLRQPSIRASLRAARSASAINAILNDSAEVKVA